MDKKIMGLSPLTEASFYVLLSFYNVNHGYGVIKNVENLTNGRLKIAAGTLYGIINSFLKHNVIELKSKDGTRSKKTYQITEEGLSLLNYEVIRLNELTKNAKEVLK